MPKQDWTKLAKALGPFPKSVSSTQVRLMRSLISYGFRELGLLGERLFQGGPGDPPPGFVGGTNSKTEWWIYWALTKILGKEGVGWSYQASYAGGRHSPGGAVIDFVVYMPMQDILMRIQTWRFHIGAGSEKITYDHEQKIAYSSAINDDVVIDVYEQDFIDDETGKKVIEVVKDALAGIEWPNPIQRGIEGDW